MDKFEMLNRQTRDYNNRNYNPTNNLRTTGSELFARKNLDTFKAHNGQYPYRPY